VEYFRRHQPDIVHAHEYTANTLGIVTAARAGVPVRIRHLHTLVPWGWEGRIRTRLRIRTDVRAARRAQLTLAVSRAVREHYLRETGLAPESCRVLYNGSDLGRFARARELGARARAELGLAEGILVVGVVGRLSRGKGHREFLRAAQGITRQVPETRFLIVGGGGRQAELEALGRELGIADRVTFTGQRDDVPALLGAMDLFLFTSGPEHGGRIQEGFGTTLVEAQAAGVPVVSFRLPMTEELVDDGVTGSVVPQGDVDAMVAASLEYLRDSTKSEAAARAARRKAREFSLETCLANTLRIYEDLLNRAR
jgi:glycosyltransferase involved in cell wall biosynthesis